MRIISGKNKGRRIFAPANLPVRPTTDMAKESLFNILNNLVDIEELEVLDLFSGTGNIAYEFVSRGCTSVTAVDSNSKCTGFISKTASMLSYGNLFIVRADFQQFLKSSYKSWDLIFADPPYQLEGFDRIPDLILESKVLKDGGMLILEHSASNSFEEHPHLIDHRKYGSVNFSFFRLEKLKRK